MKGISNAPSLATHQPPHTEKLFYLNIKTYLNTSAFKIRPDMSGDPQAYPVVKEL
jgi:hypothetical protein